MRTFAPPAPFLAFAAVLAVLASGCKKKATAVVGDDTHQNTVEVALQVVAVSPGTVAAGRQTSVTVVGAGFQTGSTVRVGHQPVTANFRNVNQLDVNLPALDAGVYDVSVMLPDTTEATLPAGLSVRGGETGGGYGGSAVDACRKVVLYFETDSSALTAESRQLLVSLVPCFNSTQVPMQVAGHADERDTTDYNLALGQRRALAVQQALVEAGVSRQRLQTTSFGEERPAERGAGEAVWSRNRRVEIPIE